MKILNGADARFGNSALWQFVKFNLVSGVVTILQLGLANLLPLIFDGVTVALPPFLRGVFDPDTLFDGPSRYITDGAVTWGYVLPFFLSNFIANIFGYYMNMKTTFRGRGTRTGLTVYCAVMTALILFSTWLQGRIAAKLAVTQYAPFARTAAAMAAGLLQAAVLFPLEKFVLFRKKEDKE